MSEFAPVIIVTGTGPSVGKTVAMAAMVVGLHAQGLRVVVGKLAQTGLPSGEPGDMQDVCRLAGEVETYEFVRLPDEHAPDADADADADADGRRAGVVFPSTADLGAKLAGIAGRDDVDVVLVEGAGGLLVRMDGEGSRLRPRAGSPSEQTWACDGAVQWAHASRSDIPRLRHLLRQHLPVADG